ncbi:MAG: PDZ domain-containing protein [Candidatus Sulfotelmatobacter sp.]
MRSRTLLALILVTTAFAQPAPKSVTIPITLDHDRVVIDVYLPLPDGTTKRIRGWVDNGNPDLEMSRRAATLLGLNVTCDDKACTAPPPSEITLRDAKTGEMKISLANIKEVKIPLKPVTAATVMVPGMSAEINLPASVLRHYDVLVDFPDREFTIAQPGALKFKGISSKILINAENGLIQVPSQIENKKYNLALDMGASISFLSEDLFDKLQSAHSDWPHMTGAVGPANMWGQDEEPKWKILRLDRLQYGPLYLTSVPMADFSKQGMSWFETRAGITTIGLLGSEALLNYRIGLDYAHSTVYFDIGSTFRAPDFDVVGLTLRPEDDTRFTILGIADFDGRPSVPGPPDGVQIGDQLVAVDGIPVPDSTMGQVWSLLEGTPGQERKLRIERAGKQFDVVAHVQHFLGELPEENDSKKKSKPKN